jgi:hypothetical protein
MKLTNLSIQNFLGAQSVDVALGKPITIFAGKNGAGKSSIQEAIRMALTGESVRVSLKKDYGQLVTDGQKSGFSEVEIDGSTRVFVTLPDGKTTPATEYVAPVALPYVLDAQRFSKSTPNDRRAFLFGLMGLSANGTEVKKRLLAKGCDEQKADSIIPMLRSGFDAACKEAQAKARDDKAAWRAITGETYGEVKAASWTAEKPVFDAQELADCERELAECEADLTAENQRMGALQAEATRHNNAKAKLPALREKAAKRDRIIEKLTRDEAELKEWELKVENTRERAAGGRKEGLVHDLAASLMMLSNAFYREAVLIALRESRPDWVELFNEMESASEKSESALDAYQRDYGDIALDQDIDIEAQSNLPEYEKGLLLLQNTVAKDKRDLAEAEEAIKAIAELELAAEQYPSDEDIKKTGEAIDDLVRERKECAKKISELKDVERKAKEAESITAKAKALHQGVEQWSVIADALSPNGIPGEILSEALGPLNDRLHQSFGTTKWLQVEVHSDMSITGGSHDYVLLSESEQWRTDAMLAEAIAHLSKLKLLVLDRFDVLDLSGRGELIEWLDTLADANQLDSALIFGTLKSAPSGLSDSIESFWIDSGSISKLREAA